MSERIVKHLPFLKFLESSNTSSNQVTTVLKYITPDQVKVLCELFLNIRYGTFKISEEDKKVFKRKIEVIRLLTTKKTKQSVRHDVIGRESKLIVTTVRRVLPYIKSNLNTNGR